MNVESAIGQLLDSLYAINPEFRATILVDKKSLNLIEDSLPTYKYLDDKFNCNTFCLTLSFQHRNKSIPIKDIDNEPR